MAKSKIKPINLARAVNDVLKECGEKAYEVLDECVDDVAEEAAEKLRAVESFSPKGHPTGNYSRSWESSKEPTGRLRTKRVVHNVVHYRLAHLLEKGHVLHNGTRRVPAYPHIAPVDDWVQEELPERVKRGLKNDL